MKFLRIIIICALVFLLQNVLWSNPNLNQIIFDQGMEHYMKRDFRGAAQYFGQVVDMQPYHYHARYYYAVSLAAQGHVRRALEQVEFLRQVFPQEQAYIELEQNIIKQSMPSMPTQKTKQAATSKRRDRKTSTSRESVVEHKDSTGTKQVAKAGKKATKVAEKPRQSASTIRKIRDFIDDKRFLDAEILAEQTLKKEPKNYDIYAALGYLEFSKKQYNRAIDHFKKSIDLGSKDFDNYFLLGSSYVSLKKPKDAASYFEQALQIEPNDIFTKQFLADIYLKDGKYVAAEKYFNEVLRVDSEVLDSRVGLAEIKFELGFIEEAVKEANEVLSRNQNNSRAHFLKARALLENKLYSEAIEESERAYNLDKSRADYLVFKSLVKIKKFKIQEALSELEEIIDKDPFNVHALVTMAEALITMGSVAQGKQMLQVAESYERLPKTSFLLALSEVEEKNYTRAERQFEIYCRRSNDSPHSLFEYAKFTELVKDKKDIISAYEKVVKLYPNTPYAADANRAIERIKSSEQKSYSPSRKVIPD